MTDRELLELASKAAGYPNASFHDMQGWGELRYGLSCGMWHHSMDTYWNPLQSDTDALRLASTMGYRERLSIEIHIVNPFDGETEPYTWVFAGKFGEFTQYHGDDPSAATRRAIVEAAAVIGKQM